MRWDNVRKKNGRRKAASDWVVRKGLSDGRHLS